jgi:uncharacterized protein YyaL (SSP411 family)
MHILSESFKNVKIWLLNSNLVIRDKNDDNCGGLHSFFDEDKKKYGFVYPEITGYFLSTLRFLNSVEKNDLYIEYGQKSAEWLLSLYEKYGGIIQGIYGQEPKKLSYSFDTAICAKGLLDYYALSNNKKFFEFGKKLINEIINETIQPDGSVLPYRNLTNNQFEEDKNIWYMQHGCLHIKIAIPILQLYSITKDNKLLEKANLLCHSVSKFQNSDGSISLHNKGGSINLHTLCYALEGLLYAFFITKNDQYLQNSIVAIDWVIEHIADDGSIELWFESKYRSKAAYPIAQLIRLMILIEKISKNKYKSHYQKLLKYLISFQAKNNISNSSGGFYEENYKTIFGWKRRNRINSWTSMFALQAMFWHENEHISFDDSIKYLF